MKYFRTVGLLFLIVLIGGVLIGFTGVGVAQEDTSSTNEEVGYWNGVYHDDVLEVSNDEGIAPAELEDVVNRSMARVEVIRGQAFQENVPVRIYTREEFRTSDETVYAGEPSQGEEWFRNQFWGSLFMIGDTENAYEQQQQVSLESVNGYYDPGSGEVVLIAEEVRAGEYKIDEELLIHELSHAMQDQYVGLWEDGLSVRSHDERLSKLMVVEGEALYMEQRFAERCDIEWDCLDDYSAGGGFVEAQNQGVIFTNYYPYATGQQLIEHQNQLTTFDKIEHLYTNPPEQTRQHLSGGDSMINESIHLYVSDTAQDNWYTVEDEGWGGREVIGQATVFTMLWYQAAENRADVSLGANEIDADYGYNEEFNYRHELTQSLVADGIIYYHTGMYEDSGFAWKQIWEDEESAVRFTDEYEAVLEANGAEEVEDITDVVSPAEQRTLQEEADSAQAYYSDDDDFGGYYLVIQKENAILILQSDYQAHLSQLRDFGNEPLFEEDYSVESILEEFEEEEESNNTDRRTDEDEGTQLITRNRIIGFLLLGFVFLYGVFTFNSSQSGRKTIRDK